MTLRTLRLNRPDLEAKGFEINNNLFFKSEEQAQEHILWQFQQKPFGNETFGFRLVMRNLRSHERWQERLSDEELLSLNLKVTDFQIVEDDVPSSDKWDIVDLGEREVKELLPLDDEDLSLDNLVTVKTGKTEHLFEVRLDGETMGTFSTRESAQKFIDNFDWEDE